MAAPTNHFKQQLKTGPAQIGLWLGLANAYTADLLASTGFDWLLIDAEHAPNDLQTVVGQLQAIAPHPVTPIVRPPWPDHVRIKQLLDLGVQTLLAPMVETGEQAAQIVAATRYPPQGIRGVGGALTRASRFDQTPDYLHTANNEICVLIQIETSRGLANLDEVITTEGVDGVFIGPSDLSASMGHLGNPQHPEMQMIIEDALRRIITAGKAAGIMIADQALAKRYLKLGAKFVAVEADTALLVKAATELARTFKNEIA